MHPAIVAFLLLLLLSSSSLWAEEKAPHDRVTAALEKESVEELETLYGQTADENEKARLEVALAMIFNQRTGKVDYARSITWFDKALLRELPDRQLADLFILRGNCRENLKHPREALSDYVRGMLVCLHFNLPLQWPERDRAGKMPVLTTNSGVDFTAPLDPAREMREKQDYADARRNRERTEEEQHLLMQRYYYIEAIKRILSAEKMTEADLRESTERLTNRPDRVEEILTLAREPNPRPWP